MCQSEKPVEYHDERLTGTCFKLIEIINMAFMGTAIPRHFAVEILLLIPKGEPGIVLLETI